MPFFEAVKASLYDDRFYMGEAQSLASARPISRLVCELLNPRSVVDVGCGWGAWLLAFEECGVARLCGIDGDYINRERMLIDPECFISRDLARPFEIPDTFDLAICLEVAEHLPDRSGRNLVRALTAAAPIVVFSAAVPSQGGSDHVNEQWPSYWRALFQSEGFRMFDPVRPRIREHANVQWWYRQNLVVYACAKAIAEHPELGPEVLSQHEIEWVHISMVKRNRDLRAMMRKLPGFMGIWTRIKPCVRPTPRSDSATANALASVRSVSRLPR